MKSRDPLSLLQPRILVVDDEYQIHASLRLRLCKDYDLTYSFGAQDALAKIAQDRFDLCMADINMPDMDGFRFIDAARKVDPQLGYVIVSAYDSDTNLRRSIPLQVYDFISKPFPEHHAFEHKIPDWIEATRARRREHTLAEQADTIANERDSARMERDVELIASESARDALMQTASLLTTTDAHYHSACLFLNDRVRSDPTLIPLLRSMEVGRRTTAAMMSVVERFLGSAYGSRDTSPALVNDGIRDALNLVLRNNLVEQLKKSVHFQPLDLQLPLRGLSGISFLLLMFPALAAALTVSYPSTTVGIRGEHFSRLDSILKDPKWRPHCWINRRNALLSHSGWLIIISATSPALSRAEIEQWLKGEYPPLASITPRGMIDGVQKCHGLLGFSLAPHEEHFRLLFALPT